MARNIAPLFGLMMSSSHILWQNLPNLASIIDLEPLTVPSDRSVIEVIEMMSQSEGSKCLLAESEDASKSGKSTNISHSAVLISNNDPSVAQIHQQLVGIFTERDLVRLIATQTDLNGVKISDVMTSEIHVLILSEQHTVITALSTLLQYRIRHLPILDTQSYLVGMATPERLRQAIQSPELLQFRTVREVMTTKVIQTNGDTTILAVAQLMVEQSVSSVVIVDRSQPPRAIGIITGKDIIQFHALELDLAQLPALAVMSTPLFCLQPEDSLLLTQSIMADRWIRRLVVANPEGELQGIITQSHLLKAIDPIEILQLANSLQAELVAISTASARINQDLRGDINKQEQVSNALRRSSITLEKKVVDSTAESRSLTAQLQAKTLEQKSTELSLEISQQGIADFIENAVIGMHLVDGQGIIVWANQAELTMLGYSAAEYIGKPLLDFHVNRPSTEASFQRLCRNEPVRNFEAQMWRKDGSICHLLIDANALFRDEQFIHARCFSRDVSEQKAGELIIKEQAALLNITTDAIVVHDFEGLIKFWNNGAEAIYGWPASEVVGMEITQLLHPDIAQETRIALELVKTTGKWDGELHKRTKSGTTVIVNSRWSLILDESGKAKSILSVDTDITEKKLLERQFLRAQRLESLGTLASGIAHDLNNILTPIVGVAQFLPMTLPTLDDRSQRLLTMLVESSKRGASLVKQILAFASGIDGDRTILQVRHILTEIVGISRQTFPKSIEIQLDLPTEDLLMVDVDATQMHQVFMNLLVNARDAMPDGGAISIAVKNLALDEFGSNSPIHVHPGSYVIIEITDTGMGMDDKTIKQIFDSFFTTKSTGTGLGLSTVLSIIKAHGGFIDVDSEIDRGTCVTVYLPTVTSTVAAEPATKSELFDGHGKLILVVDDEPLIREITKSSLEKYHYQCLLASDGIEAIALYAQNLDQVAVVLLDMMMPHLDSAYIISALRQLKPDVKIVAMSGSVSNKQVVKQLEIAGFLTKPFTITDMLRTLANL